MSKIKIQYILELQIVLLPTMSGPGDGGNGFKKKDHTLEAEFSLDPKQEDVVCVDLEGEWSEQSKIFKHPSFDDTDIKFVSGEVGEGGDHMNLTFRNVSDKSVTIAGDVIVVIVSEDPNEQPPDQIDSKAENEKAKLSSKIRDQLTIYEDIIPSANKAKSESASTWLTFHQ